MEIIGLGILGGLLAFALIYGLAFTLAWVERHYS